MNRETKWTEQDFEKMNWHDSRLYSVSFPNKLLEVTFDIDYIISFDEQKQMFELLPCQIIFHNVLNFTVDLNFSDTIGIDISEIRRKKETSSSSNKIIFWEYIIETDKGIISFKSTGYKQFSNQSPIWKKNYDLGRIKL